MALPLLLLVLWCHLSLLLGLQLLLQLWLQRLLLLQLLLRTSCV
jgi:hypothetical protein